MSPAEVAATTTLAQARLVLRCEARIQARHTMNAMPAALAANAAIHGGNGSDLYNDTAAQLLAAARSEEPPEPESLATKISRRICGT